MISNRFDVNDAELRESLLRHEVVPAAERLGESSTPRWGRMRPQEMVEHLVWAFELSTGQASTECFVPEAEWPRLKRFLYDNRPTPREFMNPALAAGLPPLRYGSLGEATRALTRELARFIVGPRSNNQLFALIRNSASRQDAKIAKTHAHNLGTEGKRPTAPGGTHPIWVIP